MAQDVTEHAQIQNCDEIVGTGDRAQCFQMIKKHLFLSELPGNQETLSETGKFDDRIIA